jgi:hypothetical protein
VKRASVVGAREHFGLDSDPNGFEFSVGRLDEQDFWTHTNLGEVAALDAQTTHKVVERGLLGVAGLNHRVEYMDRYKAVTGFKVGELSLFDEKVGFLARQFDPNASRERLDRVIELLDLPDVDPRPDVHDVDMGRLIEVVNSEEAMEFRRWLRQIDSLDDREVREQIKRVREAMAHAIHGTAGKAVRFATSTGSGSCSRPPASRSAPSTAVSPTRCCERTVQRPSLAGSIRRCPVIERIHDDGGATCGSLTRNAPRSS